MLKVGFAGLGSMGLKMAKNLLKAGFDVTGYNRTREKEAPFSITIKRRSWIYEAAPFMAGVKIPAMANNM